MYPLFEQLAEHGLYDLIPCNAEEAEDEGSSLSEYNRALRLEEGDSYDYYNYRDEDDPEDDETGYYDPEADDWVEERNNDGDDSEGRFEIDDFQSMFNNFFYLDQEEFLRLNLWDLIGVSKKQMEELVPWEHITGYSFVAFCEAFQADKRDISLDKKLKYAAIQSLQPYSDLIPETDDRPNPEEIRAYCERIIDHHSFEDTIDLIQLLTDYYRFYGSALEMNRRRSEAGQPVFKYVFFPKPTHLKDLHDKAFRDHVTTETERMSANEADLTARIKTISSLPDYRKYLYRDSNFIVLPVESQRDLTEEGEALKHCVASYGSYMASGKSYIFRIREVRNEETALYTVEVTPEEIRTHQKAQLKQCYGYKDTTDKTEKLRAFIIHWANKKNLRICCKI